MATEIGVHHIVPFHCTRSVQRGGKRERWEKIILSAVQQCGRYDIPKLHDVQHFEDALELVADIEKKWIFVCLYFCVRDNQAVLQAYISV